MERFVPPIRPENMPYAAAEFQDHWYEWDNFSIIATDARNVDLQLANLLEKRGLGVKKTQIATEQDLWQTMNGIYIGPARDFSRNIMRTRTYKALDWATSPYQSMYFERDDEGVPWYENNGWDGVKQIQIQALYHKIHGDSAERDYRRSVQPYQQDLVDVYGQEEAEKIVERNISRHSAITPHRIAEQELLSQLPEGVGHLSAKDVYQLLAEELTKELGFLRDFSK